MVWFYWGSFWYPSATLYVSGSVADVPSKVAIQWDSGQGLNGYEWERYPLKSLPDRKLSGGIPLTITRTGQHNSASLGAKVVLRGISVDGKNQTFSPDALPDGIQLDDEGMLFFKKDGASLLQTVSPESHLRLEFLKFNGAGEVEVSFGDEVTRHDLYAPNNESQWGRRHAKVVNSWFVDEEGSFTVSMPMPRYPVKLLRVDSKNQFHVESVRVQTRDGKILQVTDGVPWKNGIHFSMEENDRQLRQHFYPDRFLLQIIFALLTTWILLKLITLTGRFQGIKDLFVNEERWIFWLMLIFSCISFAFWHAAFWPGVTSNDSLEIWRAAQIPGMYLGDHPPLNVIFYIYLSLFWNNVAVVPLFQNLLTSLLVAYVFFSLYRRGLTVYCLAPCYLLVAFSLPVGLYTIILWKDVPFALLVILLGFKLACLNYDRERKAAAQISKREWASLLVLTLALVGFRHNGVLYLFVVPFVMVLFGIVRLRLFACAVLLFVLLAGGVAFFSNIGSSGTSGYLAVQTRTYLAQAVNKVSVDYLKESTRRYLGIFDVNQKDVQWDLVHLCMYGRYGNDFLRQLRWNDVYPYLPLPKNKLIKKMKDLAWKLYWASYRNPWVYFSWNPVYMLFLFPVLPLLYRKLPMSSVFSLYIFIPVVVLVFLGISNWRYYFFAHFASYFLLPMILTDISSRNKERIYPVEV